MSSSYILCVLLWQLFFLLGMKKFILLFFLINLNFLFFFSSSADFNRYSSVLRSSYAGSLTPVLRLTFFITFLSHEPDFERAKCFGLGADHTRSAYISLGCNRCCGLLRSGATEVKRKERRRNNEAEHAYS